MNCPKRWKLDYIDGLRTYDQNINTCFGSAFHKTIQNYLDIVYNKSVKEADCLNLGDELKQALFDEYKQSLVKNGNKHYTTPQELAEYYQDGEAILRYFRSHRRAYFTTKQHKLVGIEIPLQVSIINNVTFNGFIDMVIYDEVNKRYKIIDFKTSTQGWNKYQKADISKTAQLILYKEFYAKQLGVDPECIDIEYVIVRRKINETGDFPLKRIQLFQPASGKPTRNKVGKLFMEFVQNCFTEEGAHKLDSHYPALASTSCKYCPYNTEEVICPKKERLKS